MADSVRELIMKHVRTTLLGVTTAAGYMNQLQSVQRFQQDGQQLADVPMAVLVEGGDDVDSERPIELTARALTLSVVVIHRQDPAVDTRSASEVMNSLIADVQKAMQVDQTRGGLAINTIEQGIGEIDVQEGEPELVQAISYRILYRHRRVDPTIVG